MWVEKHPLVAGTVLMSVLFILGGSLVLSRISYSTVSNDGVFARPNTGDPSPVSVTPAYATDTRVTAGTKVTDVDYRPIYDAPQQAEPSQLDRSLSELFNMIAPRKDDYRSEDTKFDITSYLPSSLSSLDDIMAQQSSETTEQQAVRKYGNAVGELIHTFESIHPDQWKITKDYFEDQENKEKARAQQDLGNDYIALGTSIEAVTDMPSGFKAAHAKLVASYKDLGTKLAAVPFSSDMLAAIESYNTSAEHFSQSFVALALLFPVYGVQFSSYEGGSIFMLSPSL